MASLEAGFSVEGSSWCIAFSTDAPRVQPGIFMRSVTGWGSDGHSAVQLGNENALRPGSERGEVRNQDADSNQSASSL